MKNYIVLKNANIDLFKSIGIELESVFVGAYETIPEAKKGIERDAEYYSDLTRSFELCCTAHNPGTFWRKESGYSYDIAEEIEYKVRSSHDTTVLYYVLEINNEYLDRLTKSEEENQKLHEKIRELNKKLDAATKKDGVGYTEETIKPKKEEKSNVKFW